MLGPDADLYFAPCFFDPDREAGWYLLYPGVGGDEDVYVGPFVSYDDAVAASLEERP